MTKRLTRKMSGKQILAAIRFIQAIAFGVVAKFAHGQFDGWAMVGPSWPDREKIARGISLEKVFDSTVRLRYSKQMMTDLNWHGRGAYGPLIQFLEQHAPEMKDSAWNYTEVIEEIVSHFAPVPSAKQRVSLWKLFGQFEAGTITSEMIEE